MRLLFGQKWTIYTYLISLKASSSWHLLEALNTLHTEENFTHHHDIRSPAISPAKHYYQELRRELEFLQVLSTFIYLLLNSRYTVFTITYNVENINCSQKVNFELSYNLVTYIGEANTFYNSTVGIKSISAFSIGNIQNVLTRCKDRKHWK